MAADSEDYGNSSWWKAVKRWLWSGVRGFGRVCCNPERVKNMNRVWRRRPCGMRFCVPSLALLSRVGKQFQVFAETHSRINMLIQYAPKARKFSLSLQHVHTTCVPVTHKLKQPASLLCSRNTILKSSNLHYKEVLGTYKYCKFMSFGC